ncbi:MAG: hypothetical protein ABSB15_26885 [Bryobacteraceae bacterium]
MSFLSSNPLLRSLAFWAAIMPACAQFKEIKEAPFPPAVARQRIGTLLEKADAGNRDQTVEELSALLAWYRDILDEQLIARWKGEGRANLTLVMAPLADARVASQIVDFSWNQQREATFNLTYAPMLGDLMARYPESAKPVLNDLQGPAAPSLSPGEAQAVCRILLDMPDVGTWRKTALQILPRYRQVADSLLKQDLNGPDQERMYRALRWRSDLRLDAPVVTSQKQNPRPTLPLPKSFAAQAATPERPHIVSPPSAPLAVPGPAPYFGPRSGTFESTGGPIPENTEYVFTNLPPVKLLLDFDTKHWDARLEPGEGQTQVLVLRNKGKGAQKRCVVHWTVMP